MESSLQFSAHLFSASELSVRSLPSLSSIAVVLFCCVLANHFQSSVCFVAISLCYSLIYFSALLVSFDSFTLLLTWFYGTAPRLLGCCIFPFFFFCFLGGGGVLLFYHRVPGCQWLPRVVFSSSVCQEFLLLLP